MDGPGAVPSPVGGIGRGTWTSGWSWWTCVLSLEVRLGSRSKTPGKQHDGERNGGNTQASWRPRNPSGSLLALSRCSP